MFRAPARPGFLRAAHPKDAGLFGCNGVARPVGSPEDTDMVDGVDRPPETVGGVVVRRLVQATGITDAQARELVALLWSAQLGLTCARS